MYDFQSKRLNFEFDTLRPKETWEKKLRRLMAYFEEDTQRGTFSSPAVTH